MVLPFNSLFGYTISKKKHASESSIKAISPRELENESVEIDASGFGSMGTYVSCDPIFRNDAEQIDKYREVSLIPEVESAIDDIVNEAIVVEDSFPIELDLDNIDWLSDKIKEKITEEFENIMKLMNFKRTSHEHFKRWYIDGKSFYHLIVNESKMSEGIFEIRWVDSKCIRKITEVEKKRVAAGVQEIKRTDEYYLFSEDPQNPNSGIKIQLDTIAYGSSGLYDPREKRVLSHLHKAIKPVNQLKMLEDSVVIYRVARAPERRVFYVDVGSLPKMKAEEYLKKVMNRYKNKIVYNATTGTIVDEKVNISMLEDFWLPRREGSQGTEVITLPGGASLGEMDDVEYFRKKLLKALNVPITRLEPENGFSIGRAAEITRDELKFTKFIQRLRQRFSIILDQILRVQLVLKKIVTEEDWKKISCDLVYDFASDSQFAELKKLEIVQERMQALTAAAEFSGRFISDTWIKKNILFQTDEEMKEINKENAKQKEEGAKQSPGGNPNAAPPQDEVGADDENPDSAPEDEQAEKDREQAEKEDAEEERKKKIEDDRKKKMANR